MGNNQSKAIYPVMPNLTSEEYAELGVSDKTVGVQKERIGATCGNSARQKHS